MLSTRRADQWRLLLWAILAAASASVAYISIPRGTQSPEPPISTPSLSAPRTLSDSARDSIINELLEGWGKCEMEKPGHIVFPQDTMTRII